MTCTWAVMEWWNEIWFSVLKIIEVSSHADSEGPQGTEYPMPISSSVIE